MRVTHGVPNTLLVSELYVPDEGGSVRWFHSVYARYPTGTARVLSRHIPGRHQTETIDGVRIYRKPLKWRDGLKPFDFAEIAPAMCHYAAKLCHSGKCGVVHCARVFPEGLAGWWVRRRFGVPYAVYVHGEEVSRYQLYRIERRVMPIILREAAAVIANSNSSRDLALEAGARGDRIRVIRPGVDARRFAAIDGRWIRRRLQLGEASVLLTVGRLTPRKGHAQVLRVLPRIVERAGPIKYVIVGRGESEGELKRLATELHVDRHVVFAGLVPDEELPAFYAACDVFVMPNRRMHDGDVEGFGMVFIEAGAAAKPVIGGNSGGVPEAVVHGRTGLLVDSEDLGGLADAIVQLLGDPELCRRMGREGRTRAQREFDWDGITRQIQQLPVNGPGQVAVPVST